MKAQRAGFVANYYGGLYVLKHENKYFMFIENYDTMLNHDFELHPNDVYKQEISKKLYDELLKLDKDNE